MIILMDSHFPSTNNSVEYIESLQILYLRTTFIPQANVSTKHTNKRTVWNTIDLRLPHGMQSFKLMNTSIDSIQLLEFCMFFFFVYYSAFMLCSFVHCIRVYLLCESIKIVIISVYRKSILCWRVHCPVDQLNNHPLCSIMINEWLLVESI